MDSSPNFTAFEHELSTLVESFRRRRPHLKVEGYDEMQLRTDFLNPLWKALGWDVENRARQPQSLREVEVETRVHVGSTKKRVDYAFRIGGLPKFVCEAKKATDDLGTKSAYQAQRYAFNLKLYVAILTNFESLQMFIVGGRPEERAPFPVHKQWNFLNYEENAQEIWNLFSKDSVESHSLENLISSLKKKPIGGKAREGWLWVPERIRTVDQEFLEYIEERREDLAKGLIQNNTRKRWTEDSMNECVQRILDRILFIRICEDRDIDTGRSLDAILDEWEQIRVGQPMLYPRIVAHFNSLDLRFNGTLFHKGHESESLRVPDEFLVSMIRGLSSADSPYLFSTLPVEILGSVYERFIGKVIHITRTGKIETKLKPEVRKAGGVYYTPRYVVNYIVEQTVGAKISSKTPEELSSLKFLDPSCGSGSFLLRVFERLCEEHITWLEGHPTKQRKENCYRDETGALQLTTHLKRRIMLNNVFGVDIDSRAVEVTMLSLYLKILEGETRTTLGRNHNLFPQETFLPDLTSNIKCGNSLVGSDFYSGEQLSMIGESTVTRKVNALDWNQEFASIMAGGGFDAVFGNPPYVLLQDEFRDDAQLAYFRKKYTAASYKVDTYHLFIERGIRLCKTAAKCAMITPSNFLTNNYLAGLRRLLVDETKIGIILVIDGGVFEGVSVDNAIFVVTAGAKTTAAWPLTHVVLDAGAFRKTSEIKVHVADSDKAALFTGARTSSPLWSKVLKNSVRLSQIADVNFGKQLRDRSKFSKDVIDVGNGRVPSAYKRCYTGRDVERYFVTWAGLACLNNTSAQRGGCWDPAKQDAKNKILTRQIGSYPEFALDTAGYQCLNTMFMINTHESYDRYFILGVLNSKLIKAFWLDRFFDQRKTFPKIKGTYLEELPIFSADTPSDTAKTGIANISKLAKALIKLYRQGRTVKSEHHKRAIERQIDAAERRINSTLYELYELTATDIESIELIVARLTASPGAVLSAKALPKPGTLSGRKKQSPKRRRPSKKDTDPGGLLFT
jgi:hypothetical protein